MRVRYSCSSATYKHTESSQAAIPYLRASLGRFRRIYRNSLQTETYSNKKPLESGQKKQAWSRRNIFLLRDADFRAEAIFESVREPGRGVDHHRGRIHLAQEAHGVRIVLGNDGIGVARRVGVDMLDRFFHALHYLDRQDRRQVFGGPVRVAGVRQVGLALQDLVGCVVGAQLDLLLRVQVGQPRQHGRRDGARDQQRFHRVAGAVAVALGVERDRFRLAFLYF